MFWDIIKVGIEDVQKAFVIDADLYDLYVEKEIKLNADLMRLMQKRDSGNFDWKTETPHGGAGTSLNACVLYCLIRNYDINDVLETGVSGGYYTTFMLAALEKNNYHGLLTSIDIVNDDEVGKLVPAKYREIGNEKVDWDLKLGRSSLDVFKEWKLKNINHSAGLYSHDSLHSLSHMLRELHEFKQSQADEFVVFIDDEKSDGFWDKALHMKAFEKPGYTVKYISGKESRLNRHLGAFLRYERNKT